MIEAIGWISSLIIILTTGKQIHKQWQEGTSKGVSKWLFIGRIAAASGFLMYSMLVWNTVFVAVNAVMVINGILGLGIVLRHRQRERRAVTSMEGR